MVYLELFLIFAQVGLFGFGGGYACIPLIQSKVVDQYHWLSMGEFGDLISISQMTPGPIVINTATFVGTRIGGPWGAVVATLGSVLPSIIIVSVIAYFYKKYKHTSFVNDTMVIIHPVVAGLIGSAAFSLLMLSVFGSSSILSLDFPDFIAMSLSAVGFIVLRKFKLSPITVMLLTGAAGLALYYVFSII